MTVPYAEVIGDPISQSKSPLIHGFWIEQLGLDAAYRALRVREKELAEYLDMRRGDADWRGCNVTMPHKQAIIPMLDGLDPVARKVGAVNTVVRSPEGTLTGYNTDVSGFLEPLQPLLAKPHLFRMARVIGTGGAARAIVAALADHNFSIVLAGRNPAKAQSLLDGLAGSGETFSPPLDHFSEATDFAFDDREGILDLVINASPLGMNGQPPLLFDLSHAPPGSIVYDIVTSPAETDLLQRARSAGFTVIDGLAMLIGQAAGAFEKFFGIAPPRSDDTTLRERLAR